MGSEQTTSTELKGNTATASAHASIMPTTSSQYDRQSNVEEVERVGVVVSFDEDAVVFVTSPYKLRSAHCPSTLDIS